jgi:hypothetical protein
MIDIYRLKKLLALAPSVPASTPGRARVIPLARFLRPAEQYALPLATRKQNTKGDDA